MPFSFIYLMYTLTWDAHRLIFCMLAYWAIHTASEADLIREIGQIICLISSILLNTFPIEIFSVF